jgi:hypothetical protein
MTAPGMNLDILSGPGFVKRSQKLPGLEEAARQALRKAPPLQGIQAWELSFKDRLFGLVLKRRAQRVSLMYVFELPGEDRRFREKLLEIQQIHRAQEGS